MRLREHKIVLRGEGVLLRPMTEDDWGMLLRWNTDPDVLYFCEGDDVTSYSLEQVQRIYRGTSQNAFCFIIELGGKPIGECWLQRMNLERILSKYPGKDCRRIDLMIGEKELWGCGLGTDVIRTLTTFGFEEEGADLIFGCDIADHKLAHQHLAYGGYIVIGDIAFPTLQAREAARQRWADRWDEDEHYWAADEAIAACEGAGLLVTYRQVSSCGGVFVVKPGW